MAIRTRPIRDVLVERELAADAAAFDVAATIGEVIEESQSELMTKSDGRALAAELLQAIAESETRNADRFNQAVSLMIHVTLGALALATAVFSIIAAVT